MGGYMICLNVLWEKDARVTNATNFGDSFNLDFETVPQGIEDRDDFMKLKAKELGMYPVDGYKMVYVAIPGGKKIWNVQFCNIWMNH